VRRAPAKVAEALVSGHPLRIADPAGGTSAWESGRPKSAEQPAESKQGKRSNRQ
jgi:hypothetical protein